MDQKHRVWIIRALLFIGASGLILGFSPILTPFSVAGPGISTPSAVNSGFPVVFDPGQGSTSRVLETLPLSSFTSRAQKSAQEAGKSGTMKGISLQGLLEELTKPMTAEDRSHVDLVVFGRKNSEQKVLLPWAFVWKYPGIILSESGGKVRLVLPKELSPRLQAEGILVETLGAREVTEVTLTSYEQRYGKFLLKRRTDPAAMRGEKLYVQNCLGCHSGNQLTNQNALGLTSPEKMKQFLTEGAHPNLSGVTRWSELLDQKKTRSLASYISAFHGQNAETATP